MLQRILHTVGMEPVGSGDIEGKTVLEFDRELNEEEKANLDKVMADDPTLPPKNPGSRFLIRDVLNFQKQISEAIGYPYTLFYSESVPGSGNVDQIELHFAESLTQEQKEKVLSEYAKLISAN